MLSADASHLRKYLATLGVAIIAGTLSIAGLAMRLQSAILVKQADLVELTPEGRETLERRQGYEAAITVGLPFFVLLGVLLGAGLATYGLIGWADRQKRSDELEDNELLKSRTEVRQLTEPEQKARINVEVQSALQDYATEAEGGSDDPESSTGPELTEPEPQPETHAESEETPEHTPQPDPDGASRPQTARDPEVGTMRRAAIAQRVVEAELLLAAKLQDGFSASHLVQFGVRATSPNGFRAEFDAVASPLLPDDHQPIVIEMKYLTHPKNLLGAMQSAIARMADAVTVFENGAVPVVIAIYEGEVLKPTRMGQVWSSVSALLESFDTPPRVEILHQAEFAAMSGVALRRRLGL